MEANRVPALQPPPPLDPYIRQSIDSAKMLILHQMNSLVNSVFEQLESQVQQHLKVKTAAASAGGGVAGEQQKPSTLPSNRPTNLLSVCPAPKGVPGPVFPTKSSPPGIKQEHRDEVHHQQEAAEDEEEEEHIDVEVEEVESIPGGPGSPAFEQMLSVDEHDSDCDCSSSSKTEVDFELAQHNFDAFDAAFAAVTATATTGSHSYLMAGLPAGPQITPPEPVVTTISLQCIEEGCKLMFDSSSELAEHQKSHGLLPKRCLLRGCGSTFARGHDLNHHLATAHGNLTSWKCAFCDGDSGTHLSLSYHFRYFHQTGLFKCTNCEVTGETRNDIYSHQKMHKRYRCRYPGCTKAFGFRSVQLTHERNHLQLRPFACKWGRGTVAQCEFTSADRSAITKHIRMKHFGLPATKREQIAKGIIDGREAKDWIEKIQDTNILDMASSIGVAERPRRRQTLAGRLSANVTTN